jgi:uncharacterized protein YbjT (DUF2867 family)
MKIVVIGGTGMIGSKLVTRLRADGHDPLAASLGTGVDIITGKGLAEALDGAQVVVDVANAPDWGDAAVMDFFRTSARNILAAEAAAGVGHHVALSVVGTDRLQGSGYFRAKLAQEEAIKAAAVPWTILRATQFFEFIASIADLGTKDGAVLLPPIFFQPEAAQDVAAALADIAESAPVNGTVELAGPERFRLDELVRRYLSETGDPRQVVTDAHAPYYGIVVDDDDVLVPGGDYRVGATSFEDWLSRPAAPPPGRRPPAHSERKMMATPADGEGASLHELEVEVRAELIVAESLPEEDADGAPTAEWVQDPYAQYYEASLRTLLGAIEAQEAIEPVEDDA